MTDNSEELQHREDMVQTDLTNACSNLFKL